MSEQVQHGLGEPDGIQRLWTPYRMRYILGENKPTDGSEQECPFCSIPKGTDSDGLIVARGQLGYVVLNLYPYNPGHLMVVPFRHVAGYEELSSEETAELAELTQHALRTLATVSVPQGFNIGMNLGSVAGAGIAAHLHQHVVPRWGGDTNFMPVVAATKALPMLLADTRTLLADAW